MPEFHSEPYLHLAALTHKSVLIAWGAFYFRVRGQEEDGHWKLVDDSDLTHVHPPRHESIGAHSEPYGNARVEVFNESDLLVGGAVVNTANHAWITGLEPDTAYYYRVTINGEEWGKGQRRDWMCEDKRQGLVESGRQYTNSFRTHPHPETAASLTFAVIGDFGTGVRKPSKSGRCQREVATALERAVEKHDVRLILTTGDNIYAGKKIPILGIPIGNTGDEDDDWFFTYYQPYRYLLNRIPVYPSVGNHDSGETEKSDDRQQLLDNFYLKERFEEDVPAGRASMGPGLFYRFRFGSEVEFVCLDTSKSSILSGHRHFQHQAHRDFLQSAFADDGPKWRIPFFHHPPYCAGPLHYNSRSIIEGLTPLFKSGNVRAVLSGHEHNFQHSLVDKIEYFVTGGGGKVRDNSPSRFADARTVSWAAVPHFLIGRVEGNKLTILALDEHGKELTRFSPDGQTLTGPIVIQL